MSRRKLITLAALGASLALLSISQNAEAQRGNRGNRGGGAQNGVGGFMGGAMMGGMGGLRNMIDPSVSNYSQLLDRPDVQTELMISGRQREQLDAAKQAMAQDMGKRMRENMPDFSKMKDLSPEDRQAEATKMRDQVQTGMQTAMTEATNTQEKKLAEILDASQMKRLRQLDLQWRGALAITDKKVSAKINPDQEQEQKIAALKEEFLKARNDAMMNAFQNFRPNGAAGATGRRNRGGSAGTTTAPGDTRTTGETPPAAPATPGAPPQIDLSDIQKRMTDAQAEVDKVRIDLGEKALLIMNDDQLQVWKSLLGKKFIFRKNEQ